MPPKITVSKETTYVTGPLRPDGSVDFIAAINERCSQGVTPENNAAVAFWQAVGPKGIKAEVRDRYFALLGVAELPETGEYLVSFDGFLPIFKGRKLNSGENSPDDAWVKETNEQFSRSQETLWIKDEFPVVAALLAHNEKPLQKLVEASKMPQYFSPLVVGDGESLIHVELILGMPELREVTRQLAARAMLRIKSGDFDGACEDTSAIYRLTQGYAKGPFLVDRLVAIICQNHADAAAVMLSQQSTIGSGRLKAIQAEVSQTSLLPPITALWDKGERLFELSFVIDLASGNGRNKALNSDGEWYMSLGDESHKRVYRALRKVLRRDDIDFNEVLRCRNAMTDRALLAMKADCYRNRMEALARLEREATKAGTRAADEVLSIQWEREPPTAQIATRQFASLVNAPGHLGFAFTGGIRADARQRMQRQLVLIAFALARYQREHQKYPESLSELQPSYLDKLSTDIFNGDRPLQYKTDRKGYLVYSLGFNGKDDEGRGVGDNVVSGENQEMTNWDDIAISTPDWKPGKK